MSENKIENSYSSQMNDDLKKYMESINNIAISLFLLYGVTPSQRRRLLDLRRCV